MKLRVSSVPFCECGVMMMQHSRQNEGDGVVWFCDRCWKRYFVPWTFVDALVMPELSKHAIERQPTEAELLYPEHYKRTE